MQVKQLPRNHMFEIHGGLQLTGGYNEPLRLNRPWFNGTGRGFSWAVFNHILCFSSDILFWISLACSCSRTSLWTFSLLLFSFSNFLAFHASKFNFVWSAFVSVKNVVFVGFSIGFSCSIGDCSFSIFFRFNHSINFFSRMICCFCSSFSFSSFSLCSARSDSFRCFFFKFLSSCFCFALKRWINNKVRTGHLQFPLQPIVKRLFFQLIQSFQELRVRFIYIVC